MVIEQLPYDQVIRRYDAARTLFYLDPPYDETEGYETGFDRSDYVAMAEQLAAIAGIFVMSINDTTFIRDTFARFQIAEIPTTWQLPAGAASNGMRVTELLISNRPL